MSIVDKGRIAEGPHTFWLATCGLDTHARGSTNARNDTPWASFTADGAALVCTVWRDLLAIVKDEEIGKDRLFISIGGNSTHWKTGAVKRGRETRERLSHALAQHLPIYAFEVEATGEEQFSISRSIRHFLMDRVHQLKALREPELSRLDGRLGIFRELAARWKSSDIDALRNGIVFELEEAAGSIPGATWVPEQVGGGEPRSARYWAPLALPILVDHVRRQTDDELVPLTYEEVATRLGRLNKNGVPWARGMGAVLGMVTEIIDKATQAWPETERPPYLTTVVVQKSGTEAGLPDTGIEGRWPWFGQLSVPEKRARIRDEYARILEYGERWLRVLDCAGLQPLTVVPAGQAVVGGRGAWGGGESPEHLALKLHVLKHPELFGAPTDFKQDEYPLLSGDVIDVFFRDAKRWFGVEVKSIKSPDDDLERGIYQVVKYRAVLKAQATIHCGVDSPGISVVLAVQRQLPRHLQRVAKQLAVPWLVVDMP